MVPCDEDIATFIPTVRYSFVPIAEIASKPADKVVDVIGVVSQVRVPRCPSPHLRHTYAFHKRPR